MGNSSSTSVSVFNKNVSENINNSMMTMVQQTNSRLSGTQSMTLQNWQCERITIGSISQVQAAKFNFDNIQSSMSSSMLEAMMKNATEQAAAADANVDVEFGAIASSTASNTDVRSENINRVVNSYSLSQFQSDVNEIKLMQEMNILDMGGANCKEIKIGEISQDILMEMLVKKMSDTVTESFAGLVAENTNAQTGTSTATTKATGPIGDLGRAAGNILAGAGKMIGAAFSAPIIMMVGLVMFFVVIAFVIRIFGKMGKGSDDGMPMMGPGMGPGMDMMGGPPPPPGMGEQFANMGMAAASTSLAALTGGPAASAPAAEAEEYIDDE